MAMFIALILLQRLSSSSKTTKICVFYKFKKIIFQKLRKKNTTPLQIGQSIYSVVKSDNKRKLSIAEYRENF